MNYIVSARKYRPGKFNEVVGQAQVTTTLKNALKSGNIAQSFLFCGPRGIGKTTCARILAKAINCENPDADLEPCNSCNSCTSFQDNASFNIHELDAASHNSVDDMRNLIEQVRFPPQSGKYKVYIIDEVHMLSQQAFNAFLKTLEEPPAYAIFILATTEKHKIIPTILSRCQIYDFRRIQIKEMVEQMIHICSAESYEYEERGLHVIAEKADGAMRDALSLMDKIASFGNGNITYDAVIKNLNVLDHDQFFQITNYLMTEDSSSILTSFDEIIQNGFEGDTFILGLANHFRNLLISQDSSTHALLECSEDVKEKYIEQSQLISKSFLLNALNEASKCDAAYRMARNKRLHVELALLKICFLNARLEDVLQGKAEVKKNDKITNVALANIAPDKPVSKIAQKQEEINVAKGEETSTLVGEPLVENQVKTYSQPVEMEVSTAEDVTDKVEKEDIIAAQEEIKVKPPEPLSTGELSLEAMFNLTTVEEADENVLEVMTLNDQNVQTCWKEFLDENKESLNPTFLKTALESRPCAEGENIIYIKFNNNVSLNFVKKEGAAILEFYKNRMNIQKLKLEFRLDKKVAQTTSKKFLKPKERFLKMAEENPALLELQKKLDLDIDY